MGLLALLGESHLLSDGMPQRYVGRAGLQNRTNYVWNALQYVRNVSWEAKPLNGRVLTSQEHSQ